VKFTTKIGSTLELPAGKTDYLVFDPDNPGLGLRLRAGGSRMWVFQYALGEKQRRVTLGSATVITLGKAREAASEMHAKVRLGSIRRARRLRAGSGQPRRSRPSASGSSPASGRN
jgi:Arm DNA-binding domain